MRVSHFHVSALQGHGDSLSFTRVLYSDVTVVAVVVIEYEKMNIHLASLLTPWLDLYLSITSKSIKLPAAQGPCCRFTGPTTTV